eukprot:10799089-Lingulodinium_polyedra.AAC.1
MVTCDGGSRTARGWSVAAGAAIVWARVPEGWTRVLTLTRAMPAGASARVAEAWAAHGGLSAR